MATTTQPMMTGSDTPKGTLTVPLDPSASKEAASGKAGIQYPLQSVSDMMAQYTQAVRAKVTHEATLAYLGAELASLQAKIKEEKTKFKAVQQLESKARQAWERAHVMERHTMLESTLESLQDEGIKITKKATRLVTKKLVGRKRARTTHGDETPAEKAKREARNEKQRQYRAKKRGQAVPSKPLAAGAGTKESVKDVPMPTPEPEQEHSSAPASASASSD